MKKQKYFLGLTIAIGVSFLIVCASIIFCVLKASSVSETQKVQHIMGFAYLFIHLIVVAVAFYLSLKAYLIRPGIINVIMTNEDGTLNKKARIRALVFAIFGTILAITFFLASIGVFKALTFFSIGLRLALLNVGFTVGIVAFFLFCYKPFISK